MNNVVSFQTNLADSPASDTLVTDWVETSSFRFYMKNAKSQPVLQQKWTSQSTLNEQWRNVQVVIGNEPDENDIPVLGSA